MKKFLRVLSGILGVCGICVFGLMLYAVAVDLSHFSGLFISAVFLAYGIGGEKVIGAVFPGLLRSKW
jgi:hypothetical protein